jgi:hypothetical protein
LITHCNPLGGRTTEKKNLFLKSFSTNLSFHIIRSAGLCIEQERKKERKKERNKERKKERKKERNIKGKNDFSEIYINVVCYFY